MLIKNNVYEVLDEKWYQEYAIPLLQDSEKEFIVPIGFYIDALETVTYQRYSFKPLLMFPLILN
jgi:protoheme ferro-lyase